ncbi:uncharacterized protein LOC133195792 [Saccostrea echinata]|uniref:uncharacterized protein LOC133195792 n=1 Tax=Saccostrea echinata TaxID=191078 RepID=UPI002A80C049|nr:uncharacterized protein LOC133195792 [Saccostrea echinata]
MLRQIFVTVVFCLQFPTSYQQSSFSGQNPQAKVFDYYMDSHAECGKTFELGLNSATVYGKGAVQTGDSPTSCTIILSTDGIREHRRFSIELVTGFINSPGVNFYIYDGQWSQNSGAQTLAAFSYYNNPPTNMQKLITSGGFVTFSLTRDSPDLFGYGFVIHVQPIPADISNPNNCDDGAGFGCENYYYNPIITKSEVIYIVAAIFGVGLVIVVPSVLVYCYCRQKGLNRRWQERRLKDGAPNTAATSLNGSVRSAPRSIRPWQSEGSKQAFASIRKSPVSSRRWSRPPTDEEDSVFDDFPKRPPPPPPYEEHDRYRVARDGRDTRRDNSKRDHHYRERKHSESSNYTSGREQYSDEKDQYSDEKDDSFVQADDDHPQENFVERIIEPRVHRKSAGRVNRRPDVDQEDGYDSIGNIKSDKKDKKKMNTETQCSKESDSEGSPETENEAGSTEEEEVSSHSEEEEQDPRTSLYAQPDKARKGGKKKDETKADKPTVLQPQPSATSTILQPGVPYQARPPGMVMQRAPLQGYPVGPSNPPINPSLRFMPPVGQIVRPAYPVSNQFNPAGPFPPANPIARLPMPASATVPNVPRAMPLKNLPVSQSKPVVEQLNNSGDAPKYSYLVNRGYDTGRTSPVSTTTSYSQQSYVLDDSAVNIDLGSGIELMKRTTTDV